MSSIKKLLVLILSNVLALNLLFSVVHHRVGFDGVNKSVSGDLSQLFNVQHNAFTELSSNGIEGGSIRPLDNPSWHNDYASYKYSFSSSIGETLETSVDFYYDPELINPNQYARPVGIFLYPSSSSSDKISTYIDRSKHWSIPKLQIVTYSWAASNTGDADLVVISKGWYQLKLKVESLGGSFNDEIKIDSYVYSLGDDGKSSPVQVSHSNGIIYNSKFPVDKNISVRIHGARWGGAEVLDNFTFKGPTQSVVEEENQSDFPLQGWTWMEKLPWIYNYNLGKWYYMTSIDGENYLYDYTEKTWIKLSSE